MKKLIGTTLAIAAVAVAFASPAFATAQLSDVIDNTGAQITTVPTYINYVAYIIGTALLIAGLAKLRAHADNPSQTPMKDGLVRLFAGIAFMSLPFIVGMLRASTSTTSGSATFSSIDEMAP